MLVSLPTWCVLLGAVSSKQRIQQTLTCTRHYSASTYGMWCEQCVHSAVYDLPKVVYLPTRPACDREQQHCLLCDVKCAVDALRVKPEGWVPNVFDCLLISMNMKRMPHHTSGRSGNTVAAPPSTSGAEKPVPPPSKGLSSEPQPAKHVDDKAALPSKSQQS
jgi:hypothetical protein